MVDATHPFHFEDLISVERISDPAVHPAGFLIAYVGETHDAAENVVRRTIKLWDTRGGEARELTPGAHNDTSPRWSPDGSTLAFVSDRSGEEQLWLLPFSSGGEAYQRTWGYGGVSQPVWAPEGSRIAYARRVTIARHAPEQDRLEALDHEEGDQGEDVEQRRRATAYGLPNEASSARIADGLLFRHWNVWRKRDRSHLFILDISSGESEDIIAGDIDVPPISLGGSQDFVFSPDGAEIAFIMNPDAGVATSTNNSLFVQSLDGIRPVEAARCLSENEAMELEPRYSPDGRYLAFLGAERAGYEADRLRIKLVERTNDPAGGSVTRRNDQYCGGTAVLTEKFDRSVSSFVWRSKKELLFLAEDRGYKSLYGVSFEQSYQGGVVPGSVVQYTSAVFQEELRLVDTDTILVTRETARRAAFLSVVRLDAPSPADTATGPGLPAYQDQEPVRRLDANSRLFAAAEMQSLESFWYRGADDDWIHGFLLKPPDFEATRRYPLLLLIHGGPQGAFADSFHFRWNAQVFAAEGYVVLMTNPRGSTGYGQSFTDQISGDWAGRCYTDIMNGVDAALESCPFIDSKRMAAAGASFGGFMINWIAGHSTRFAALVSHDGIFNQETMSYTTDELWFDIWEHGGMPYENPEAFRRQSPHNSVDAFNTPTLVIQGERDYRCPPSEGIGMFTALQVRQVPSRFLYFPDEGHFVTKPANAEVWYKTVLEFLAEWL